MVDSKVTKPANLRSGAQAAQDGSIVYTNGRLPNPNRSQNGGSHIRSDGQIGSFCVGSARAESTVPPSRSGCRPRTELRSQRLRIHDEAVTGPVQNLSGEAHHRSPQPALQGSLIGCKPAIEIHGPPSQKKEKTVDPEAVLEAQHVEWSGQPLLRWGMTEQRMLQALEYWKPL